METDAQRSDDTRAVGDIRLMASRFAGDPGVFLSRHGGRLMHCWVPSGTDIASQQHKRELVQRSSMVGNWRIGTVVESSMRICSCLPLSVDGTGEISREQGEGRERCQSRWTCFEINRQRGRHSQRFFESIIIKDTRESNCENNCLPAALLVAMVQTTATMKNFGPKLQRLLWRGWQLALR